MNQVFSCQTKKNQSLLETLHLKQEMKVATYSYSEDIITLATYTCETSDKCI